MQGDVVAIYDTNGAEIARYTYDAWGNCSIAASTTDYAVALANPIRYRGYYFDQETNLYYLNARYYNPEWRRFISPENANSLNPQMVNGLNLYVYANNNPIRIAHNSSVVGIAVSRGIMSNSSNSLIISNLGTINYGFSWPNLDFLGAGFGYIENSFSMVAGLIDGIRKIKHLDKLARLDKASDWLMGIGVGINVGLSIYNNLTNSHLTSVQKNENILGDGFYIAASSVATWGISALTAMIPIVGPFIAPIIGFGFGTAFDQFWHGEDILGINNFSFNPGGKSIDEWIRHFLTELFGG